MTRLPRFPINKLRVENGGGLFFSAAVTLLFLWPLWGRFSTHLPSREDGIFISYTIYWVSYALQTGQNLWQVPIFHPHIFTWAYSDPFLPSGLMTLLIWPFTQNIVTLHNIQLVLGTFLLSWGSWLLGIKLFQSRSAAAVVAIIATVGPLHWLYTVHLHTFLLWGIPFCLYFGCRWLESRQQRYLWFALICFLYQVLNAPMTGLFLSFMLLPLLLQSNVRKLLRSEWPAVAGASIILITAISVVYYPYFWVSRHFEYVRTIRDAAHFSYSLDRLWQPDVVILLGLLVILWWWGRGVEKKQPLITLRSMWLIAIIGGILMLGPVLKLHEQTFKIWSLPIPLPYAPLYYVLPFFQGFRAVSRWGVVFNFGLALLIGYYLSQARLHWFSKGLVVLVVAGIFWLTQVPTWQLFKIPQELPEAYTLLTDQTKVVAEFPALSWRMMPFSWWENDRLLYQTHHHQALFNGASGFTPPSREQALDSLWMTFPSDSSILYLQKQGVMQILVHFNQYQILWAAQFKYAEHAAPNPDDLQRQLNTQTLLRIDGCTPDACLYTIK